MHKNEELICQAYCRPTYGIIYEIRHFIVGPLKSKKGPVFELYNNTGIFLLVVGPNNVTPFLDCTYIF